MDAQELRVAHTRCGKHGKVQILVTVGESVVFTDKCDVADAEGRKRFLREFVEKCPGLPRDELEARLGQIAGEILLAEMNSDEPAANNDCDLLAAIVRDQDKIELFHSCSVTDMETYATVRFDTHLETWPTRSSGFSLWLRHAFYTRHKRAPSSQHIVDAMSLVECLALFDGPEHKVFIRLARVGDEIWVDLADKDRRAIRISAYGWEVVEGCNVSVRFSRRPGMLDLPLPEGGGHIDELRPFVNVRDDEQWVLLAGSLPALLRPEGPYPILSFSGQQGSAKSSTSKKLKLLVDPSRTSVRRLPREERDLMIGASNAHILNFDNLSFIPPSISDALCMLSTGGGFAARALFTDSDEKLFEARRPIFLNGIEDVASKADILDRCVIFDLPPIGEDKRREEAELDLAFERARPRIFGALLDAVSTALRRFGSIVLSRRPRMLDFAKWCTAAETSFGWPEGTFLSAYMRNRADAQAIAMEATSIGRPLLSFMAGREVWQGIAENLLAQLELLASHSVKERTDWPSNGRGMSGALRRLAPALPAFGLTVEFGVRSSDHDRDRILTIWRVAMPSSEPSGCPVRADIWSDDPDDPDGRVAPPDLETEQPHVAPTGFQESLGWDGVATQPSGPSGPSGEEGMRTEALGGPDDPDGRVAMLAEDATVGETTGEVTPGDSAGKAGTGPSTTSGPSAAESGSLFCNEGYGMAWGH